MDYRILTGGTLSMRVDGFGKHFLSRNKILKLWSKQPSITPLGLYKENLCLNCQDKVQQTLF